MTATITCSMFSDPLHMDSIASNNFVWQSTGLYLKIKHVCSLLKILLLLNWIYLLYLIILLLCLFTFIYRYIFITILNISWHADCYIHVHTLLCTFIVTMQQYIQLLTSGCHAYVQVFYSQKQAGIQWWWRRENHWEASSQRCSGSVEHL